MSDTRIEWADKVWNPVTGCTKISEGCTNCYAERMSKRLAGRCGYPANDPFQVTLHEDRLNQPLDWKKSHRIFVCSMGDLFHDEVPFEFIASVFGSISAARHHIFMILTKRPKRMEEFFTWYRRDWLLDYDWMWPKEFPHVWLGVTAENQQMANERIPILLRIPAAVRFVSVEPMLTDINLARYLKVPICKHWEQDGNPDIYGKYHWEMQSLYAADWVGLDWVIAGGESGPDARPMHPDWVRSLRDQCTTAQVPFLFKQWGHWITSYDAGYRSNETDKYGRTFGQQWAKAFYRFPDGQEMVPVGKGKAGREVDGRTWDDFPQVRG